MTRWLFTFALMLTAGAAQAAFCSGTDLRKTLRNDEAAQLDASLEREPYARGNHWLARKGNQTIHVIGTMHLDDPRWGPIITALGPVVAAADQLFVEMTDDDQVEMQLALTEQPEKVFITDGPTLPELLSDDDWQALRSVMAERGLPGFMAAKMQPWMQTLMLSLPSCAIDNPDLAKGGLDMRLIRVAHDAGVPVESLESFDEIYALIAGGTVEEQLDMLMASLPFAADSEDQFATTAALYFEEASAAAWEFARVMAHRRSDLSSDEIDAMMATFKSNLLDKRNHAWMDRILASHEPTIVVAVGALHLFGDTGVLNLLAREGYTLERVPFSGPE